mmetsp:Transcript_68371/g.138645  ORF Transcript_68371/g.138645 Transcript_68371/m.138645 type:complete len:255 (+) Transcript_68371:164-928(+)
MARSTSSTSGDARAWKRSQVSCLKSSPSFTSSSILMASRRGSGSGTDGAIPESLGACGCGPKMPSHSRGSSLDKHCTKALDASGIPKQYDSASGISCGVSSSRGFSKLGPLIGNRGFGVKWKKRDTAMETTEAAAADFMSTTLSNKVPRTSNDDICSTTAQAKVMLLLQACDRTVLITRAKCSSASSPSGRTPENCCTKRIIKPSTGKTGGPSMSKQIKTAKSSAMHLVPKKMKLVNTASPRSRRYPATLFGKW